MHIRLEVLLILPFFEIISTDSAPQMLIVWSLNVLVRISRVCQHELMGDLSLLLPLELDKVESYVLKALQIEEDWSPIRNAFNMSEYRDDLPEWHR